jgi:hypothetical protein
MQLYFVVCPKIDISKLCAPLGPVNVLTEKFPNTVKRPLSELISVKNVIRIIGLNSYPRKKNIVTDLTVLQIWTLLINGPVRISALLRNGFPNTRDRNINLLLRNVYKQNAYFRGNEYCQLLTVS